MSDVAFQLRVAEQQLAGLEVADLRVDERNLGPPQPMGAGSRRLKIEEPHPAIRQASVLARGDVLAVATAAVEEPAVSTPVTRAVGATALKL